MDSVVRIGEPIPGFSLPDLAGKPHSPDDARGRIVVLCFWSAECPWSRRADERLAALRRIWADRVRVWNVASNAIETLEAMSAAADSRQAHPVLCDQGQRLADVLGAVTTPQVFVFDQEGRLRYAGALDDATFRQRTPTREYLADAVQALLSGEEPDPAETSSYGCAISRHAGNSSG